MISPVPSQCFVYGIRESRPQYPLNQEKQSAASDRAPRTMIPAFADFVTVLHRDLSILPAASRWSLVGE